MIDWTKPLETTDGRPAWLLMDDYYASKEKAAYRFICCISDGTRHVICAVDVNGFDSFYTRLRNAPVVTKRYTRVYHDRVNHDKTLHLGMTYPLPKHPDLCNSSDPAGVLIETYHDGVFVGLSLVEGEIPDDE